MLKKFNILVFIGAALLLAQTNSIAGKITYPQGAPKIASDFNSRTGVNGRTRATWHQGIDIRGNSGQEIIAAANGRVLEVHNERCWGPTVAINHGNDKNNERIIALYGHVDEIFVKQGDLVKRGQLIAKLGKVIGQKKCTVGVRHLHFQIGRKYRKLNEKFNYWGWSYFLKDGAKSVNPHEHWAGGSYQVTCFQEGVEYASGTLTYPVPCSP